MAKKKVFFLLFLQSVVGFFSKISNFQKIEKILIKKLKFSKSQGKWESISKNMFFDLFAGQIVKKGTFFFESKG